MTEELRREEVARSRQTEYKTMMRSELLSDKLKTVSDDKELISNTLELASFRGDMLQSRLTAVLEETEDTKSVAIQALGKLEDVSALSRYQAPI